MDTLKQAEIEFEAIKLLQEDISRSIANYMAKENIGFNELVRRLGMSAAQTIKIQLSKRSRI